MAQVGGFLTWGVWTKLSLLERGDTRLSPNLTVRHFHCETRFTLSLATIPKPRPSYWLSEHEYIYYILNSLVPTKAVNSRTLLANQCQRAREANVSLFEGFYVFLYWNSIINIYLQNILLPTRNTSSNADDSKNLYLFRENIFSKTIPHNLEEKPGKIILYPNVMVLVVRIMSHWQCEEFSSVAVVSANLRGLSADVLFQL